MLYWSQPTLIAFQPGAKQNKENRQKGLLHTDMLMQDLNYEMQDSLAYLDSLCEH